MILAKGHAKEIPKIMPTLRDKSTKLSVMGARSLWCLADELNLCYRFCFKVISLTLN